MAIIANKNRMTESLCFYCKNARADRCAWIARKEQVWDRATTSQAKDYTKYKVVSCQNFVEEEREYESIPNKCI